MQLNLTGHHVDITPSLREYVDSKMERLERHFDHINHLHVILTVEKLEHRAEAKVDVSGNELFADAKEGDMYAAIDRLVDKLDRQVKKHKEKLTDHHAREGRREARLP
jgi:putative sigma-54 modulation protein